LHDPLLVLLLCCPSLRFAFPCASWLEAHEKLVNALHVFMHVQRQI
jgi:hypothetical protein